MSEKHIPQDSEVDLGSLFKIIGKGFKNLFDAIGSFFKAIGHFIVLSLLFLRNNALKLGIAAILGAGVGLYLDLTQPTKYYSYMVVEPNFKSTQQLYHTIDFYDELVKQKDTILLAETFKISSKEASDLKGFEIKPIKNENEKYELYDEFINQVDSVTIRYINFKDFKKGFTEYDYKYHRIKIISLDNTIFERLSSAIINSVESNAYFKNQKEINDLNLLQNERILLKSLDEVDTLRKIYNEVLITEARKTATGTSITLAQGVKKTEEIELFSESLDLNKDLITNNKEKAESTEILNIVSTFGKVGTQQRSILTKMTFLLGLGAVAVVMVFILLLQLNSFLLNYRNR